MSENKQLNSFITKADIAALPVLPHTLQVLKAALELPGFSYRHLDTILQYDPACMINLLAYANQEVNNDFDKEISQVDHAAMFLGMDRLEKFISNITSLYSVQNKKVADKLSRLQHRGVHAAFQAQSFAQLINNSSDREIYTSALVSPVSELLCWHLEPLKAQKVELLICRDTINYKQAQQDVFGFTYHELAKALTHHWHIPALFLQRQEMDELDEASHPIKCMYLAEKCSIIAEHGWYYDKMYEHIQLCAETFHYSEEHIARMLHSIAVTMAHSVSEFYPVQTTVNQLALLAGKVPYTQIIPIEEKKKPSLKKSKPQAVRKKPAAKPQRAIIASIKLIHSASDFPTLIRLTMDALFETKAFNRVAFIMLSKDKKQLQVRSLRGYTSKQFSDTAINMQSANLFSRLLTKPQSVFINHKNYPKFAPLINQTMQDMLNVKEFIAKSVYAKKRPIGLFYMDKHPLDNNVPQTMTSEDVKQMKKICALFDKQLSLIS